MVKTRVLSGVVLAIVTATLLLLGGYVLLAVLYIISLIALFELHKACKNHTEGTKASSLEIAGYGMVTLYYAVTAFANSEAYALPCLIFAVIVLMCVYVFTFPKYQADQIMREFFCIVYGPVMLSFVFLVRNLNQGVYFVWIIFISSWVCDTCAYAVGMLFGKHKMAPVLSPKKSIEGAIGGVAGAFIVGALYGYFVMLPMIGNRMIVLGAALIGAVGACISQVGDLAASAIKRNHEIKDYGNLIPGHGGIMDRFDSVIFTAPIVFFLAVYLLQFMNI